MTDILTRIIEILNIAANGLGRVLLAPLAVLPGWLSATIVAFATGVLLLFVFKYTSNQSAIKRVRNDIDANLFAIKLFKDATPVVLASQAALFGGAFRLFVLAIVPMLVMMAPVLLMLGQISLWYQQRPLQVGEQTVVSMKLSGTPADPMPVVTLEETPAAEVVTGPVRVPSQREVVWLLKARQDGSQPLVFKTDGQAVTKDLQIGNGMMRVSPRRPSQRWDDVLLNPAEPAFAAASPVQAIDIGYPTRTSWTHGTDHWVIYWFLASMVGAFCAKPFLKVNL